MDNQSKIVEVHLPGRGRPLVSVKTGVVSLAFPVPGKGGYCELNVSHRGRRNADGLEIWEPPIDLALQLFFKAAISELDNAGRPDLVRDASDFMETMQERVNLLLEIQRLRLVEQRFNSLRRWDGRPHACTDTVWIEPGQS